MQECVNNVLKHSEATRARIAIRRNDDGILITTEDNGRGFSPDEQRQGKRGFGLTGIAERTKMLGGAHKISSSSGQGTAISVSIPLEE